MLADRDLRIMLHKADGDGILRGLKGPATETKTAGKEHVPGQQ